MLANLTERFSTLKGFFKKHPATFVGEGNHFSIRFKGSKLSLEITIQQGVAKIEVFGFELFSKELFFPGLVFKRIVSIIIEELRHEHLGLVLCEKPVSRLLLPVSNMPEFENWKHILLPGSQSEFHYYLELRTGYIRTLISYGQAYFQFFTSFQKNNPTMTFDLNKILLDDVDDYYFNGHHGQIKLQLTLEGGKIIDQAYGEYDFSTPKELQSQTEKLFERIYYDLRLKSLFNSPQKHFDDFYSKYFGNPFLLFNDDRGDKLRNAFLQYLDNDEVEALLMNAEKKDLMRINNIQLFQIEHFFVLHHHKEFLCFPNEHKERAFLKMKELSFLEFENAFAKAFKKHEDFFEEITSTLKKES